MESKIVADLIYFSTTKPEINVERQVIVKFMYKTGQTTCNKMFTYKK